VAVKGAGAADYPGIQSVIDRVQQLQRSQCTTHHIDQTQRHAAVANKRAFTPHQLTHERPQDFG